MVIESRVEDFGGISDTALGIVIVLTRARLSNRPAIAVSFARRMVIAQASAREDRDEVIAVDNACEPVTELAVDVVGKVLVFDLCRKVVRSSSVRVGRYLSALVAVRNRSK